MYELVRHIGSADRGATAGYVLRRGDIAVASVFYVDDSIGTEESGVVATALSTDLAIALGEAVGMNGEQIRETVLALEFAVGV